MNKKEKLNHCKFSNLWSYCGSTFSIWLLRLEAGALKFLSWLLFILFNFSLAFALSLAHTLVHTHPHTHTSIHTRSLLPLHSSRSCATGFASTAIVLCHREQKAKGSRVKVLNEFFITRSSLKYKFSSAGVRKVGSVRERVLVCERERENEREEREVESMGNEIPAKRFSFKEFLSDLQQKRKFLNFLVLSYFFTSISQLCMHSCTCTHTGTHTCTHTGTTTSMHSCESEHTHSHTH